MNKKVILLLFILAFLPSAVAETWTNGDSITQDFLLEVAKGNVEQHQNFLIFGRNPDTDVGSSPETIWRFGGQYPFLATAQTLLVSSSSVADTTLGTGARRVLLVGLNSTYHPISEIINMTGVLPVTTSNQYFRVLRAITFDVGTAGTTQGNIDFVSTTTAQTVARIGAGVDQTELGVFTVPVNKTAFIVTKLFSINPVSSGTKQARIVMKVRPNDLSLIGADSPFITIHTVVLSTDGTGTVVVDSKIPFAIPQRTDVEFEIIALDNNVDSIVEAEVLLVDNEALALAETGSLAPQQGSGFIPSGSFISNFLFNLLSNLQQIILGLLESLP